MSASPRRENLLMKLELAHRAGLSPQRFISRHIFALRETNFSRDGILKDPNVLDPAKHVIGCLERGQARGVKTNVHTLKSRRGSFDSPCTSFFRPTLKCYGSVRLQRRRYCGFGKHPTHRSSEACQLHIHHRRRGSQKRGRCSGSV